MKTISDFLTRFLNRFLLLPTAVFVSFQSLFKGDNFLFSSPPQTPCLVFFSRLSFLLFLLFFSSNITCFSQSDSLEILKRNEDLKQADLQEFRELKNLQYFDLLPNVGWNFEQQSVVLGFSFSQILGLFKNKKYNKAKRRQIDLRYSYLVEKELEELRKEKQREQKEIKMKSVKVLELKHKKQELATSVKIQVFEEKIFMIDSLKAVNNKITPSEYYQKKVTILQKRKTISTLRNQIEVLQRSLKDDHTL